MTSNQALEKKCSINFEKNCIGINCVMWKITGSAFKINFNGKYEHLDKEDREGFCDLLHKGD